LAAEALPAAALALAEALELALAGPTALGLGVAPVDEVGVTLLLEADPVLAVLGLRTRLLVAG